MSNSRYLTLAMFFVYACVAIVLVAKLGKLDFQKLAIKVMQSSTDTKGTSDEQVPLPMTIPSSDILKVSEDYEFAAAEPVAYHRNETPVQSFTNINELMADLATLDGTLNSASPVLPYFTRN